MSQQVFARRPGRRYSLSVYISFVLVAIAVIPLLVTVGGIEAFLRPSLISQIGTDMERDAQTHVQLIDTYLAERLNDIKSLSQSDTIKNVLTNAPNSKQLASDTLFTTQHRDVSDYMSLSILNRTGDTVIMAYPAAPALHGKYLIQPDILKRIGTSSKVLVSDVFYDSLANNPSVDLYARIVDNDLQPVGIIRASMSLHRLWQPVDSTPQAEGADSYGFVLDQHGVRIAYTNPDHSGFTHPSYLFKAIGPLSEAFQRRIQDENLYGNATTAVSSAADTILATQQENVRAPLIFQFQPSEQRETFESARYSSAVVPWTYYVLKPLNTVTGLVDQQLFGIVLIVAFMILLALVIGIQVSRSITRPIMLSVALLRKNSVTLKALASEEQVVAVEQSWMVEASQAAQQAVKYYNNAASIAAQQMSILSTQMIEKPADKVMLDRSLKDMAEAARYIQLAVQHQKSANEKLAAALRVTTRASDQLTQGAMSTDEAAAELENIVQQLMAVIGTRETKNTDGSFHN